MTFESKQSQWRPLFRENFESEQHTRSLWGTPTDVSFVGGKGVFDGTAYINIDSKLSAVKGTTTGTWSCWIKPVDATPASTNTIIAFWDTSARGWLIRLWLEVNGILRAQVFTSWANQWVIATDAKQFFDNQWTHAVLVHTGSTIILYIDGVAVAQTITVTVDTTMWFSDVPLIDNGRMAIVIGTHEVK